MVFKTIRARVASIILRYTRTPVTGLRRHNDHLQPDRDANKRWRRELFVEGMLPAEYTRARADVDRAMHNPDKVSDIDICCKRYVPASARIRKFLAYGEVPPDIAEKVNVEYESV